MSGSISNNGTVTLRTGLFRSYGTPTSTIEDIQSAVAGATSVLDEVNAAAAAAQGAIDTATAAAATASSATSTALTQINAAVSSATSTINSLASGATTSASNSATAAASSASAASTSQTAAASSATAAANSATTATTQASAASNSATNAASSASAAAASATTASSQASASSASATTAAVWASSAAASAAQTVASVYGLKNVIMNGAMNVWQRGTTLTPSTAYSYCADMVQAGFYQPGGTLTVSQVAVTDANVLADGLSNALSWAVTGSPSGGTTNYLQFVVENPRTLAGQTVRLSFWAKADASRSIVATLGAYPGTGGSPAGNYALGGVSLNLTTSWQRFTTTGTLNAASTITPGTNGNGYLFVRLDLPLSVAMSMQITGVQLRPDTGALQPFEVLPPALELAMCQRYYETGYTNSRIYCNSLSTAMALFVQFSVTKRVTPTMTLSNFVYASASGATTDSLHINGFRLVYTTGTTNPVADVSATWAASAEL